MDLNWPLLNKMRSKKEMTDFGVIVEGQYFACHKLILLLRSEYFRKTLNNNAMATITIKFIDLKTWEQILEFIYTNEINNLGTRNIFLIHESSIKLEISSLEKLCAKFILNHTVNFVDLIGICCLASRVNDKSLLKKLIPEIVRNIALCCNYGKFYNLPFSAFKQIAQELSLYVTHDYKIQIIMNWIKRKRDRKPYTQELLSLVDLTFVRKETLIKYIEAGVTY